MSKIQRRNFLSALGLGATFGLWPRSTEARGAVISKGSAPRQVQTTFYSDLYGEYVKSEGPRIFEYCEKVIDYISVDIGMSTVDISKVPDGYHAISLKAIYKAVTAMFDRPEMMVYPRPMTAYSPQIFSFINGWRCTPRSISKMAGGSVESDGQTYLCIKTIGTIPQSCIQNPNAGRVRVDVFESTTKIVSYKAPYSGHVEMLVPRWGDSMRVSVGPRGFESSYTIETRRSVGTQHVPLFIPPSVVLATDL